MYVLLLQFTHWVDAVIFVFSLENEMSFQAVYSHFAKMAQYRDTKEIPLILVGTQGLHNFISEFLLLIIFKKIGVDIFLYVLPCTHI